MRYGPRLYGPYNQEKPRKEVPALGKLKEWTQRRIPGGLTRKLHGRLSR